MNTIFHLVPLSKFRSIYHMNKSDADVSTPYLRRITAYQLALTEAMYRREKRRADDLDELLDRMNGDF